MTINDTIALLNETFPNMTEQVFDKFGNEIYDTPADQVVDYEGGWGSYVKIGVIILKVSFIVIMMGLGVIAH